MADRCPALRRTLLDPRWSRDFADLGLTSVAVKRGRVSQTCTSTGVHPLAPAPWLNWLHRECAEDWAIVDEWSAEGGDRLWFENPTDALLFEVTFPELRR